MQLTSDQIDDLQRDGIITVRDDDITTLGLAVALNRLRASAARHNPPRCADCHDDIHEPQIHSRLCADCAARSAELAA